MRSRGDGRGVQTSSGVGNAFIYWLCNSVAAVDIVGISTIDHESARGEIVRDGGLGEQGM